MGRGSKCPKNIHMVYVWLLSKYYKKEITFRPHYNNLIVDMLDILIQFLKDNRKNPLKYRGTAVDIKHVFIFW